MNVVLDTNVLISYLLSPNSNSAASQVVRLALNEEYKFVFPSRIYEELRRNVSSKVFLGDQIAKESVEVLVRCLLEVALRVVHTHEVPSHAPIRDKNDDFLVREDLLRHVDYIVTGDKDLLVLGSYQGVHIVTPREFLIMLALED